MPSSDALPELRAWSPEDAKLHWSWSRGKEDGGTWRLGIRAFGAPLTCAAWMSGDDDGGLANPNPNPNPNLTLTLTLTLTLPLPLPLTLPGAGPDARRATRAEANPSPTLT